MKRPSLAGLGLPSFNLWKIFGKSLGNLREFMLPHRLLVHIPFHYQPQRLAYLQRLLANFNTYDLEELAVVVDTNDPRTQAALASTAPALAYDLTLRVHPNLPHPFDLTWVHRPQMAAQSRHYDSFMYVEDDILIPWPSFVAWWRDQAALYDQGWLRGFLRVEQNANGTAFLADFSEPMGQPTVRSIKGRRFFQPDYPYHACWVYSQRQLQDFMNSLYWDEANHSRCLPTWSQGRGMRFKREKAAFGMTYLPLGQKGQNNQGESPAAHRVLLPLTAQGQAVDPDALIYHLPQNYRQDACSHFAKIPVGQIFADPRFWQVHPIALKLGFHRLMAKISRKLKRVLPAAGDPG